MRGIAQSKLKDNQGLIADLTKAITFNPDYAEAYYYRGLSKRKLGDKPGAKSDYKKASALGQKVPQQELDLCQ